jgi:hypothetical protein
VLPKSLSDDLKAGDELTVKSINPRHANVLKVENSKGQSTFISHYDMILKEKLGARGANGEIEPE